MVAGLYYNFLKAKKGFCKTSLFLTSFEEYIFYYEVV